MIDLSALPEECPRWEGCGATLCPLLRMTEEQARGLVWYSDEEICVQFTKLWWVKTQRRLRRAKQPGGFTIHMVATMKKLGDGLMSERETVDGWLNKRN